MGEVPGDVMELTAQVQVRVSLTFSQVSPKMFGCCQDSRDMEGKAWLHAPTARLLV